MARSPVECQVLLCYPHESAAPQVGSNVGIKT